MEENVFFFLGGGVYANVVVIISEGKVNASDGFVSFPRSLTSHRTAGLFFVFRS